MDIDDFDIDRSTEEAWDAFSVRLSEVLSMMDNGAELQLGMLSTAETTAPYVEYACPKLGRIVAQASANASLAQGHKLSEQQLSLLEQLGWQSPINETTNFTSEWSQDQTDDLADLSIRTLRDVYGVLHPVFLAADELSDVLQPSGPSEPPYRTPPEKTSKVDTSALVPIDATELDRLVGVELERIYGSAQFHDSVGDYAIRVGTTMVFVRIPTDAKEVIAFSAVVHDVSGRSRAAEVLNDLNSESRWVRFWLLRDKVFVSMSALAQPFVPAHFQQVIQEVATVADSIDEHLARTLQGRTTFSTPEE